MLLQQLIMTRNLIYHIAPFKLSEEWRLNLDRLAVSQDLFTGKRLIAIAEGDSLESASMVESYLQDRFKSMPEIMIVQNNVDAWELESFPRLLRAIRDCEGATFYGHAKGVSPGSEWYLDAIRTWRGLMYDYCLPSDGNLIESVLSDYACAGCFLTPGPPICAELSSECKFHFRGSFFWFNNQELFSRNWDGYDGGKLGTECYPGRIFDLSEAHCLFGRQEKPESFYCWDDARWELLIRDERLPSP